MGVEIIQGRISLQFDPPVLEVIIDRFSLPDENKSFAILDDDSYIPDEPYRVGK